MSSETIKLTLAQALVKYLCAQKTEIDGETLPLFAGVWAIFGHGNVPAMGEALYGAREELPTYRGQNEQSMAHAAIGYAKQMRRKRMMAVTSSIGPGATNLVTAAAVAHVNRLPVLLLPGDVFVHRAGAPVLQEVEYQNDATISANDTLRPVSNYFDRLTKPEQIITSLPRAVSVLTDADRCGPVTLCLPQDVQAESYDFPSSFFTEKIHRQDRSGADNDTLTNAADLIRQAKRPLLVAGGGVHYSEATEALKAFAQKHKVPVCETSAGKGALPYSEKYNVGGIGVVGASSANELAAKADLVIAVGTRLNDFTTGSRSVISNPRIRQININVTHFDAHKHDAFAVRGDAKRTLEELELHLQSWSSDPQWDAEISAAKERWTDIVGTATAWDGSVSPSDAQVTKLIGDSADSTKDVLVVAAGTMPSEGVKLWQCEHTRSYHSEYGFSCMGYELSAAIGVKMADPASEVYAVVGDGTYMMMNSEIFTSVMLGTKVIIVVLDNRGFACISRLQDGCGADQFNNLLDEGTYTVGGPAPTIDFAAHAGAMGALSESVAGLNDFPAALQRARAADKTYVIALKTRADVSMTGGSWWQVGIPEVSTKKSVTDARAEWQDHGRKRQPYQ